jgi:uncharacterized membrane protein
MSTLVAIVYPDEFRAAEVLAAVQRLQDRFLVNLADSCCVTRDKEGHVKLHQSFNVTSAGALNGALWGTLVGLVFFNPLVGLAAGTAVGALAGKSSDHGIPDQFMQDLGEKMVPGSSAVFMLIRMMTFDKLESELAKFGGHILYADLSKEQAAHLENLLSAAPAPTGGGPSAQKPGDR